MQGGARWIRRLWNFPVDLSDMVKQSVPPRPNQEHGMRKALFISVSLMSLGGCGYVTNGEETVYNIEGTDVVCAKQRSWCGLPR